LKLLDIETVVGINRMTVQLHGGIFLPPDNIRAGQGLGFIEQVRVNSVFGQVLYPTPYHQAAAYLFYVVKNHTFNDGNKRTGLACALTILEINDLPVRELAPIGAERFLLAIASRGGDPGLEIDRIAQWLQPKPPKMPRRR
jgi:death-on-curing protein